MSDEVRINTYEGLFLFPQAALADLEGTANHVRQLLDRAEAEVISLGKWDERRLAYDIKGNKRGLYLIAYFKAPTQNMARLERDCNLSEQLLRAMIVRAEGVSEETMRSTADEQKLLDEARMRETEAETADEKPAAETADA